MPKYHFATGRGSTKIEEKHLTDQTAAIAETTFCTAYGIAPAYLDLTIKLTYYLVCVQAGTSGVAKVRFRWTDTSGQVQSWDSANINLNNLGDVTSGVCFTGMPDSNSATYEVIISGGGGTYKYDLFLHAEQM